MRERVKAGYPAIIVSRAPVIPERATDAEREAIEDADAMAALLMFVEDHGRCGGRSFGPEADTLRCNCGELAFEVRLPEKTRVTG